MRGIVPEAGSWGKWIDGLDFFEKPATVSATKKQQQE
jgi:hypothetical protein